MDNLSFVQDMNKELQVNQKSKDSEDWYFTESDYQELQRNLALYKEGNREACEYIIVAFNSFLTKYTRFICNGDVPYYTYTDKNGRKYSKISPTITQFVSLFTDNTTEEKDKKKKFSITCHKIRALFSKYEYGDIYNELVLALLNMANKYKIITDPNDKHYKKNGTFHMYVNKCFHWEAHRFLKGLVKDPLSHFELLRLQDQFEDIELEINDTIILKDEKYERDFEKLIDKICRDVSIENSTKITLKETDDFDVYDDEALNFNWTNGITCSDLFKVLTPYERELMVLSFIQKKSETQISELYGCPRITINLHKRRAVQKIKEKAQQLNMIRE